MAPARGRAAYAGVSCPFCVEPLEHDRLVSGIQKCPHCDGVFEAVRFDPPVPSSQAAPLAPGTGTGTACANHPANAAVTNCERCGVFMCDLCRIDADEAAFCPGCYDRLSSEGALASTRTSFRDHARQASSYALLGLLFWFFAVAIGPFAVYYGIRGVRQKRAMGEKEGRVGAWVAIFLGAVETVGSAAFLFAAFKG